MFGGGLSDPLVAWPANGNRPSLPTQPAKHVPRQCLAFSLSGICYAGGSVVWYRQAGRDVSLRRVHPQLRWRC
jgi:hypothetical protein